MKSAKPNSRAVRPVLRLFDFEKQRREESARETRAALFELHGMVCAGNAVDLALVFRDAFGHERCIVTGAYKADPALGVNAAVRMTQLLTRMQEGL